jgi:hypothetical protein
MTSAASDPAAAQPDGGATATGGALVLHLDGFDGPLDLLLELARGQKVDLARISILSLVEQYLAVIAGARDIKLELAADWLVMAAWLTWLKSRLLLPPGTACRRISLRSTAPNSHSTCPAWSAPISPPFGAGEPARSTARPA